MGFEGKNHRKDTKKAVAFDCNCLIFRWCHQESNRGHKDFQSFALPTELWHHFAMGLYRCFSITGANVEFFYLPAKCLGNYFSNYFILFLLIADFQRIVLHVYLHSR